jgi:hypothetical protein
METIPESVVDTSREEHSKDLGALKSEKDPPDYGFIFRRKYGKDPSKLSLHQINGIVFAKPPKKKSIWRKIWEAIRLYESVPISEINIPICMVPPPPRLVSTFGYKSIGEKEI